MWKPDLSAANHVRLIFMPPKGRTATGTVVFAVPGTAPVFELDKLPRRLFHEVFDRVLVAQPSPPPTVSLKCCSGCRPP